MRFLRLPVGARHCDCCGGEEEELVHRRKDCGIGVKIQDARVSSLVEGIDFGKAIGPCRCRDFLLANFVIAEKR